MNREQDRWDAGELDYKSERDTVAVWRPIPGYEAYEVSDEGQVRRGGRIIKPQASHNGRLRVHLSNRRRISIHRLVLLAFVGPAPPGTQARHYPDPDPTNNRLENLSWATPKVNQRDRIEHGTYLNGDRVHLAKLTWEQVRAIRSMAGTHQEIADQFGIDRSNVSQILRGETWCEK